MKQKEQRKILQIKKNKNRIYKFWWAKQCLNFDKFYIQIYSYSNTKESQWKWNESQFQQLAKLAEISLVQQL